ncbi:MAG: tRNA(Ile)-lysidine synthase [Pedosphaera sp.]|nr:tRNA(Ile)-lysidine synthase [Pedosphaera sp.]
MLQRVEKSIIDRQLFRRGQSILVAVSGGLDSMVLLHLLARLSKTHGWRLTVAHFNHQLRGRSSDADERLVQRTAAKLGLPCVADRADVLEYGRKHKQSLEMAARKLRHAAFARIASKNRIRTIALAHHADDQVELFLLRLLRGAGGEGLGGMKWQNPSPAQPKITLVRPLLDQFKSELEDWAKEESLAFREDATNSQLDIQRNRIRRELLPTLARDYQPAIARVILRQMDILAAESEFVNDAARGWLNAPKRPPFETLPLALQRRCLHLQLVALGVSPNFDLIEQLRETPDRVVTINQSAAIFRDLAGRIHSRPSGESDFNFSQIEVQMKGRAGEFTFGKVKISWELELARSGTVHALKQGANCEYFDADAVGSALVLRHWRPGDRFQPIGMGVSAKLQDLFVNQKILRSRRHQLIVGAVAGGELFWVEGLRLAEQFKLHKKTIRLLKWCWDRLY